MIQILKNIFSHKKLLFSAIFLVILSLGILFKIGLLGSSAPQYKTIIVTRGNLSNVINASGSVLSENSTTLSFLTSGRVYSINFDKGDFVKKGQIIASLDTTQTQNAVSKAEANYKSAISALNKVLDDIHLSQYGNGGFANVGTANETQTQRTAREEAEMVRDAAYQDLQSAKVNLEWSTIIAPFDGVISEVTNLKVGQNVTAANWKFRHKNRSRNYETF